MERSAIYANKSADAAALGVIPAGFDILGVWPEVPWPDKFLLNMLMDNPSIVLPVLNSHTYKDIHEMDCKMHFSKQNPKKQPRSLQQVQLPNHLKVAKKFHLRSTRLQTLSQFNHLRGRPSF